MRRAWQIWLVVLATMALMGVVVCAGCGDDESTTTTAAQATTTSASSETTGPSASETTSTSAAVQHEPTEIILQSFTVGSSAYTIFFALAEVINEHSDWLTATAVESGGNVENVEQLMLNKTNMMIHANLAMFYQSQAGVEPFVEQYTFAPIARSEPFSLPMLTFDENIKTYADLGGKTLNMLFPGSTAFTVGSAVLQHLGIGEDGFKYIAAGFDKGKDDLLDGTIDATTQSLNFDIPPGVTSPIEELWASGRSVYCVGLPQGEENAVAKIVKDKTGSFLPFSFSVIPQSEHENFLGDWQVINGNNMFAVDLEMDPEIVKEVLRILYEYKDEFPAYFEPTKNWSLEGFVDVWVESQYWHPAALEFWKDLGVEPMYVQPDL